MKKLSLIIITLILLIGCEKNDNTCNCNDPLKDLVWLKELKVSLTNCSCEMSIIQGTYNKQTVFYQAMTDALCDGIYPIVLLDCNGVTVKSYESANQVPDNEITNIKVLYRCKTK
jgi:uncharacterized protein YcfL